ncbi:MAG: Proton/peptide symporter, family protein [Gammaproteobacteria bacterium]|nr:Proton/peptide symporter, family protein [Gammaproteobacteria bacterium]
MLNTLPTSTRILAIFCGTEMWERYGFYVVQALLALYLSFHLRLSDAETYALVGSFTALTYISPIIGGWIADKFLGQKRAVMTGAIVLSSSYVVVSFATSINILLLSLALIAVGTGLLKPNISAMLGRQYEYGDPKRNSGFTIFYLGITVGIILGTVLPIKLQNIFGWKVCFLSAALGAAFAFLVFFYGIRKLDIKEYAHFTQRMLTNWCIAIGVLILSFFLFYGVLLYPYVADTFFLVVVLIATGIVLRIAQKEQGCQRYKTLSLLLLFVISVFFWAFYFEMFIVLTLFITRVVEPVVLGIAFPAPYYVAVQSLGMIFFGLILSKLWAKMKHKNVAHVTGVKFTFSIICMLIAYSIILLLVSSNQSAALLSPWPILGAYLMISLAELLLSPIGLSAVTQLASQKVVSTMMGIFFVSLGIGGFLAGRLAEFAVIKDTADSIVLMKMQYLSGFQNLVIILVGVLFVTCIFAFTITRLTKRVMWEQPVADTKAPKMCHQE